MRAARIVGRVLLVLAALAVALIAAFYFFALRPKLAGPPPPACRGAAPPRSTAWSAPRQLTDAASPGSRTYDVEPHATVRNDGALALAFNPRDTIVWGRSGLSFGLLRDNGAPDLRPYQTDRQEAFDVWMAAGARTLHAVWLAHDGGRPEKNMKVEHAQSEDGLSWSPPERAHAPSDYEESQRGGLDKPMVIVTSDDVAHVFYYAEKRDGLVVSHGPGFETSDRVPGGAYGSVARGADDALHVVTMTGDEESEDASSWGDRAVAVAYTVSTDHGHSWRARVRVNADTEPVPFFFSNPQVAVDDARHLLYVAYPSGLPDGQWQLRLATSSDGGITWQRRDADDAVACATRMAPQMAIEATTGVVHLTWLDNRDGHGFVAYVRCAPGGQCAKVERISEPFARFSFARHLPHWLGEYGALVVDEERGVLHAVWSQTVEERGDPVSRIFHATRSVR
jgi:hypothetical protein